MAQTATPTYDDDNYLGEDPGLTRLYDNVQAVVPALVLPTLKMVTWNTIEDFYIRSTWKRALLSWCMPEHVRSIDFNPYDGDWLVSYILDIDGLSRWLIEQPATLIDASRPLSPGERRGHVQVALKPVSLDAELDAELFTTYFDTILNGVLGRLYSQPAKPYTSQQAGLLYLKQYRVGVNGAKIIAKKQYGPGPGQWSYPYYADGRAKN